MSILRVVLRSAGRASLLLTALGLAGAACNAGLIAVVHRALEDGAAGAALGWAFAGLGLGKALCAYGAGRVAESYSQRSITALRRELIAKLVAVPYPRFERLGAARAYAALTADVGSVNAALQASAGAAVQAAVLLGGGAYLLYLDPRTLAVLSAAGGASLYLYAAMSRRARALLRRARAEYDRLYAHFEALTSGAKELRLHAGRRHAFVSGPLHDSNQALLEYVVRSHAGYLAAQAVNGLIVLAMIGLVLFVIAPGGAGSSIAAGYVLAGLYLTGPLSGLLRMLPIYASAQVALDRIHELGIQLGASPAEPDADPRSPPTFARLELRQVTHRYDDGAAFALGPLSLELAPGELLFVTGGNGSGKSTLGKLLTGLYEPASGAVLWDGRELTIERRDAYRQLWSAVFSEFHLFDRLYGLPALDLDARAATLLAQLGLSHAVSVRDGALSTTALSRGQRRRLALLAALLEDRPAYLFDEWAADQDPEFKEIFYRALLPELARRGKAVVAITHDDRYFDVADRVIRLRDGRVHEPAPTQIRRAVPP